MTNRQPNILIVDDTRVNRLILESGLPEKGFSVTSASGGKEALELLGLPSDEPGDPPFDAVVLDIMMPEIDGNSVLKTVRKHHTAITLPIIMATAKDRSEDIVTSLDLGANDYVTKPVDVPVLCARLSTQIELSRIHQSLKQAQKSLLHSAKMESVGLLAAGVAHEIRNPLSQIQMAADGLKGKVGQDADEASVFFIETIEEGVRKADDIVKGLMKFSSSSRLAIEEGDINALLENAIELTEEEAAEARVRVGCDLKPDLPAARFARDELGQAIINILLNAIQAAGESGGAVTVRSDCYVLSGLAADEGARTGNHPRNGDRVISVVIEDDGPGIAVDKLINVFDAFYTTRPTGSGTGLGLTIARKIIDLHDGMIQVENREDTSGIRVTVLLKTQGTFSTAV